jgi:adenylate cyclase
MDGSSSSRYFRGLFRKYLLVLFMAVAIPLAINGVIEAWFGYRDQRARLDQLLGIQATSAAARIHGFIDDITNELGWLVQLPWTDDPTSGGGLTHCACFAKSLPS